MCLFALPLVSCVAAGAPSPEFLDDHDMIWELPPARWLEGIPLANGHIGALVWGDGAPLKITLDKYDAWETRERVLGEGDITYAKLRQYVKEGKQKEAAECLDKGLYKGRQGEVPFPTRLPMPRLQIDFGGTMTWQDARLRLRTAATEIRAKVGDQPLTIGLAVHAKQNVLVLRLEGKAGGAAKLHAGLDHLDANAKRILKGWGYPDPTVTTTDGGGTLHVKAPTGFEYAIAWERGPLKDREGQLICLSLLSNEDVKDPLAAAQALARKACEAGGEIASHEAWWAEYWKRSYLTIPDARLEALYYIEMYKLACSSRPGGYPTTLQGLWTLDGGMPPWSGDYHLDMNVQETYWPIYAANRLELGEPLYRVFSACVPRWRKQCEQFFGFDGIWSGASIGPKGERIFGYSAVQVWPGNAAWLTHHYWLHFLYSQDKAFLKEQALPIMRLAFLTYANLLEPGGDGRLHIPLSNSPEWGEGGFSAFCKDPTCDLELIQYLGRAILHANAVLGVEDEITPRVKDVLAKVTPPHRSGNRLMISEGVGLSQSHRHHSHLMGIHPLGVRNLDDGGENRALVQGSLHEISLRGTGLWTGWAFPWMSCIASRARYGNMAWQMLDMYANAFIKTNTFHVNGDPRVFGVSQFRYEPMTLEAGFAAAAAIMEMLIQSHGGKIRLFPSMPDRWHDAYFAELRAEGAFVVTSKKAGGNVMFAIIRSEAGLPCELVNPFGGAAEVVRADREGSAAKVEGDILRFDTEAGGSYLVYPAGKRPEGKDIEPVRFERTAVDRHFYGTKRQPRF
ncbi:MAG: glycoside hydrolase N-terminal domain-containing protein [Phycisphaerae bacterium]|nr:glycoside hydrolase N-terminal domain-containing protein [Phycisphaerae bacterium]